MRELCPGCHGTRKVVIHVVKSNGKVERESFVCFTCLGRGWIEPGGNEY